MRIVLFPNGQNTSASEYFGIPIEETDDAYLMMVFRDGKSSFGVVGKDNVLPVEVDSLHLDQVEVIDDTHLAGVGVGDRGCVVSYATHDEEETLILFEGNDDQLCYPQFAIIGTDVEYVEGDDKDEVGKRN